MPPRKPAPLERPSGLAAETLAAQALGLRDPATGAIVPPLVASAPYERAPDGSYPGGHSYTRDRNPTYDPCEALLARLEGGCEALLFGSGMAAATTVFETLPPGSHVVAPAEMYWTIRLWLQERAAAGRLALDFAPNGDIDALRRTVRPGVTRIVWVETPSATPNCSLWSPGRRSG